MRLLRRRESERQLSSLPLDVIFLSIDLELSSSERTAILQDWAFIPLAKELGIASLDTRRISSLGLRHPSRPVASKHNIEYSTTHASRDFEDCDVTNFQECIFSETKLIRPAEMVASLSRYLQVLDTTCDNTSKVLRSIVLVGHSIIHYINILRRLGSDIPGPFPIVTVLDTNLLSGHVSTADSQPGRFTLSGVLNWLGCPHKQHDLHNAGKRCYLHAVRDAIISSQVVRAAGSNSRSGR